MPAPRVCVGVVIGAQGLRGAVRIKSFTADPQDLGAYGPVSLDDGRALKLTVTGVVRDAVVAKLTGVADRNAAEALKGAKLYIDRGALPAPEDGSYYHADLIGLAVRLTTGEARGRISAVFNFGAGDVIEVTRPGGDTELLPFSAAAVAKVDVAGGEVLINPLPGLFDDEEGEATSTPP